MVANDIILTVLFWAMVLVTFVSLLSLPFRRNAAHRLRALASIAFTVCFVVYDFRMPVAYNIRVDLLLLLSMLALSWLLFLLGFALPQPK
jgi:hypothetical protein